MKQKEFVEHIVENREQIVEVLEIDALKKELRVLKKEMEMVALLKRLFQNDESKLDEVKSQNKQLKKSIEDAQRTIQKLEQKEREQECLIQTLQEEKSSLQQALEEAKKTPLHEIEALYGRLTPSTHLGIKNSLHSNDPLILFASGILHIEPIWEFAKYLLQEGKMEDFKILREIFYRLFDAYGKVKGVAYQNVLTGDEFDSHIHIRDPQSEPSGAIEEILLKGFCDDGEIIKKTVVRVV